MRCDCYVPRRVRLGRIVRTVVFDTTVRCHSVLAVLATVAAACSQRQRLVLASSVSFLDVPAELGLSARPSSSAQRTWQARARMASPPALVDTTTSPTGTSLIQAAVVWHHSFADQLNHHGDDETFHDCREGTSNASTSGKLPRAPWPARRPSWVRALCGRRCQPLITN